MSKQPGDNKQLVILGAGPGGYSAAFRAAELGQKVTLIDSRDRAGGVCLFEGCIPSKALLDVCRVMKDAAHARQRGIEFGEPKIRIDPLQRWQGKVIARLAGGLQQMIKSRKIEFIHGHATLLDGQSLEVREAKGKTRRIRFENAILATGSQPAHLPDEPDSDSIVDSDTAVRLPDVPGSLLVIGGGYIGLEMGLVYSWMGSRVTLVEMTDGLLPGVDRDLVKVLHREMEERFESLRLGTMVRELKPEKKGRTERIKVSWKEGKQKSPATFDRVLVAIGRRPNSRGIGLENTSIQTDDRGYVRVNAQRRTDEEHIYAVGDLTGEPMLAHKAFHEGRIAAGAIAGRKVAYDPRAIPAVVFTEPEVAWCGLTETDAQQQEREVKVLRFHWKAASRALTLDHPEGLTKLVTDPKTGRILGMGVVGPGAAELISEGVLAVEMAALADDLSLSIHPHPTLSETIQEAAGRR